MINIAIFASGNGTNAQTLIDYFKDRQDVKIALIVSNNPKAFVLERADKHQIHSLLLNRESFYNTNEIVDSLKEKNIALIVLAGFLWMIPQNLIQAFPNRIVNIHPALLPKYGGKGMYGNNVHKAVLAANEPESGISIHYVNEKYDEGEILLQEKCKIDKTDTEFTLSKKIQHLEHAFFPKVIDTLVKKLNH